MELRYTIAARLHRLHKCSCPWTSDAPPTRAYTGAYGELVAASFLRAEGLKVLRRNYREYGDWEIDLVCRDEDTLVFCEVKSTLHAEHGGPARAIDRGKRTRLREGALNWVSGLPFIVPVRFDVVEVYLPAGGFPRIEWQKAAFGFREGGREF